MGFTVGALAFRSLPYQLVLPDAEDLRVGDSELVTDYMHDNVSRPCHARSFCVCKFWSIGFQFWCPLGCCRFRVQGFMSLVAGIRESTVVKRVQDFGVYCLESGVWRV